MKINRPSASRIKEKHRTRKATHSLAPKKIQFKKSLEDSIKKELRKKLDFLVKEIDREGEHVVRTKTLDSLHKYKKLVQNFLAMAVKNSYLLSEKINLNPRGKQNILILVEKIDSSLEELMQMVVDKEVDNLNLLEKVGEIRGMLIDTYS